MKRWITLCLLAIFITGCAGGVQAQQHTTSTPGINNHVTGTINPVTSPTSTPGSSTTPTTGNTPPTTTNNPEPNPGSNTTTGSGSHGCDSGNCDNPWGYTIHPGMHDITVYIYNPAGDFCGWFRCISNFWNGNGYVAVCFDGMMSKSGGIQGACSSHGGEWTPLWQVTGQAQPTPQPQPTPTPIPIQPTPTEAPSPVPTIPIEPSDTP